MRESTIEAYLRDRVRQVGGRAYKFVSPGNDGVPDRMVCFPGGRIVFAELKALGQKPRPLQLVQIDRLQRLGFGVLVIDSKEKVDRFVDSMAGDGA